MHVVSCVSLTPYIIYSNHVLSKSVAEVPRQVTFRNPRDELAEVKKNLYLYNLITRLNLAFNRIIASLSLFLVPNTIRGDVVDVAEANRDRTCNAQPRQGTGLKVHKRVRSAR
jgi:hypothetical protein